MRGQVRASAGSQSTPDDGDTDAMDSLARRQRAETIVKDHTLMSLGGGILPLPLIDLVATLTIQLTMIGRLCSLYGVPFSRQAVRAIIMALVGGLGSAGVARGLFWSTVKLIPGAGAVAGLVAGPVGIAAITWALGKLFVGHFESGGTLLTFNTEASRQYFRDLVERGKTAVGGWTAKGAPAVAKAPGGQA